MSKKKRTPPDTVVLDHACILVAIRANLRRRKIGRHQIKYIAADILDGVRPSIAARLANWDPAAMRMVFLHAVQNIT
jgi:hypothetical protein